MQSLDAQAALLPYALAAFAIGLPIFGWVCSYAEDRAWAVATLLIFAINWAAFYALVDRIRRNLDGRADTALRTRLHVLGGLLWAAAVVQVSLLGLGAGTAREPVLLLAAAMATVCVVFSAPNLPTLLIVAPAASASPILALYAHDATRPVGRLVLAATALAMALSLILNRLLRGLFTLASEREKLIEERAQSLIDAQKLARSKSDLVATLSHEIRNGLNGVADVLAAATGAGGRAAPSRDQLSAALGSTRDLIAVLNATVDSESVEAGRLVVARAAFDAVKLTRELVLLNAPLAGAKGLELTIHVDDSLDDPASGATVGDAARTRQVLSNLIDNAIKYTVRGRVEVRVELLGHDRLRLAVADTGPGLTDDELTAAFEAFNRVQRTGAGVPGAGLGLSLARRLGTLMGGEVTAESALGVGSCFRLDLPFEAGAQADGGSETTLRAIVSDRDFRALRVLVGEHDALQAAMLRTILEQLGHQVVNAQNGGRVRDLARTVEFDLVMLNGRLAETDGPAAIQTIRELEGPVARAAIIAVIDGDAEEARACLEAGANSVLRRPLTVANVARTLAAARRAAREAASPSRLAPVRKAS
ncbi:MAG TPA: ATP-binding protein [Caulobacteraceae bacterium]|nr:ATP-binding protein [Caulobacteraceae bacterium]